MADNVIPLGADDKVRADQEAWVKSLFGPQRLGSDLIVDGRLIPNVHIHDMGAEIEFILDGRLGFVFPRDLAPQAAAFAANAMAIGAGYAYVGGETKERPFAPQCFGIESLPEK